MKCTNIPVENKKKKNPFDKTCPEVSAYRTATNKLECKVDVKIILK